MHHCIVHIDGGARGNPGPAGVGVVLADGDDGTPLHEAGYFIGRATNNVAEYHGLLRSLELAAAMHAQHLTVRSDSQLLVRQINGEYRVKSADLKPLYQQAQKLLRQFEQTTIEHVRREQNGRADALANLAMDAKRDVIEVDGSPFMTAPRESADSPRKPQQSAPPRSALRWTLTLTGDASACPAHQPVGEAFTFGPTTPAGCCIHAASAALKDGPLGWQTDQHEGQTHCDRCRASLLLQRLD